MGNALVVSVLYIVVAVSLTIWLAATLYRNGLELLRQRDDQQPLLAQATARLLVIGFALFTLGYAFLLLQVRGEMTGVVALQFLIRRLGILLVSLGLLHLLNTLIFLRFRRSRAEEDQAAERSARRPQRRTTISTDEDRSSSRRKTIGSPFFVVTCLSAPTIPPTVTTSPSRRRSSSASEQSVLRRSCARTPSSGCSET